MAAGLCFVVMLVNYFLRDLTGFAETSAFASFGALAVVVLILGVIIRLLTKSTFAALLTATVLEAALTVTYMVDATLFEGLLPSIMEELSLFERFYVFIEGTFDVAGIVYFLSVIGVFLFLTIQSVEKRRWSE